MKINKNEIGITLIALIISIIVLIILASITLNYIFSKNIINKGKDAVEEYKIQMYQEKINLIVQNEYIRKFAGEIPDVTVDGLIVIFTNDENTSWISKAFKDDTDENTLHLITTDGYKFIVIVSPDGKFEVKPDGIQNGIPTLKLELMNEDDKKAKIKATATEKEQGIEYILCVENNDKREYTDSPKEKIEEFEVTNNGIYTIIVKGKNGKENKKTITVNNIIGEIYIQRVPDVVTNKDVEINIIWPEGTENMQKKYSVDGGTNWSEYSGTIKLADNGIVKAKLIDNNGKESSETQLIVDNIDKQNPIISNAKAEVEKNKLTISADVVDKGNNGLNESFIGIKKVQYSINGTDYKDTNTFENLTGGEYTVYIKATDLAGNEEQIQFNKEVVYYPIKDKIKVGDYIEYVGGNYSNWRVLYTGSEGYGIQIISKDVVTTRTLSGRNDYANCIKILNDLCQPYKDNVFAISARSVGSNPAQPNSKETIGTNIVVYGNTSATDNYYSYDFNQMLPDMKPASQSYWFTSRFVDTSKAGYYYFDIRVVYAEGNDMRSPIYAVHSSGQNADASKTHGIRPVITLNDNIMIIGGDGKEKSAWKITL